ncbi:MAG: NmrA/HSCARG family protein [Candidatus Marinimicrobia bacterium]|nr:NmrA/HSCARG family protein [Candidatus Neomarinimicrobiota bacterium]
MSEDKKIILVTGATGTQGGSVIRNLADKGYELRALTRNPESEKALALKTSGVNVFKGDMNDPESLKEPLDGAYGVFSVQNFWEAGNEGEITLGKAIATSAKEADVKHFVYTSVASADKNTGIVHFDSKFTIEEFIRSIDIPYTIIRPVFFMDNFFMMKEQIDQGNIMNAILSDVPIQMLASNDIGRIVARVFEDRENYLGKAFDIAGDSLTMPEAARIFGTKLGKEIRYTTLSMEDFSSAMGEEYAGMVDWFNKVGYSVDIDVLEKSTDLKLEKFSDWVSNIDW